MLETEEPAKTHNAGKKAVETPEPTVSASIKEAGQEEQMMVEENVNVEGEIDGKSLEKETHDELNMGLWNIPKYVAKKKKLPNARGTVKRNEEVVQSEATRKEKHKTKVENIDATHEVQNVNEDLNLGGTTNANDGGANVNVIPRKIRNSTGGRNPQNIPKGKQNVKASKGSTVKERHFVIGESSKTGGGRKPVTSRNDNLGKENVPNSDQQQVIEDKRKKEEEYMLEYMKAMYQTHGVNLLNKFRNEESIRTALGQIDENDKMRVVALQRKANAGGNQAVKHGEQIQQTTANETLMQEEGDTSPMDATEEIIPQQIHISL